MHIALAAVSGGSAEDEAGELFYQVRHMRLGLPCRAWSDPKIQGAHAEGWRQRGC